MQVQEREYPVVFGEVDRVHQARYQFALGYVQPGARILDAASGVGYGSHYMATNTRCERVIGLEISDEALAWANRHFQSDKVTYIQADLTGDFSSKLPFTQFDLITSFETMEHLKEDKFFLQQLHRLLKPTGYLLLSVPNEDYIPLVRANNPYHYRHYRSAELIQYVRSMGFTVVDQWSQTWQETLFRGVGGDVNIVVLRNVPADKVVFNDLDAIISQCYVVKSKLNHLTGRMGLTSLARQFDALLGQYTLFSQALSLVGEGRLDDAVSLAESIDPSLCPERDFALAIAYEAKNDAPRVAHHLKALLERRTQIKPDLAENAEAMLASMGQTVRVSLTDTWEAIPTDRFVDEAASAKVQRVAEFTSADVLMAPVVYELFPDHRIARWEPVAWRKGGSGQKSERVEAPVIGKTPDLPYQDAYTAFAAGDYETALARFADHCVQSTTPEDQAVYTRWVALSLLELGRDAEMIDLLADARIAHPGNMDILYLLYQVLRLNGQSDLLDEISETVMMNGDSTDYPEFFYDIRSLISRIAE